MSITEIACMKGIAVETNVQWLLWKHNMNWLANSFESTVWIWHDELVHEISASVGSTT